MQDIPNLTILGIEQKPTRTGGQKFTVKFSNGQGYATFDPNLASKAQSLGGQIVTARIEQNGQYWNLTDIIPSGQAAAGMPLATGNVVPMTSAPVGAPNGGGRQNDPERESRIQRGNALNAVGSLLGPLVASGHFHDKGGSGQIDTARLCAAVTSLCDTFVFYLAHGSQPTSAPMGTPAMMPVQPQQQPPVGIPGVAPGTATPEQVAAFAAANGMQVVVGAPVTQEQAAAAPGIPF